MSTHGRCRCGAILRFDDGPQGLKTRCDRCGAVVRLRGGLRRRKRRKRRQGDTDLAAAAPTLPPLPPAPNEQVVGTVELVPVARPAPAAVPAFRPPWRHPAVWAACAAALLLVAGVLFWCARR